jgi:hypothetical protein
MHVISANDLKTKGVSAIESALSESPEAIVAVRGQERYVVMSLDHYHHLRACELERAWMEVREEAASGQYRAETPEAHLERVRRDMA